MLLNSGIGDASELSALGVEPVHDLPEVGKGLTDHTGASLVWNVNSQDPVYVSRLPFYGFLIADPFVHFPHPSLRAPCLTSIDQDAALEEWRQNKTGPMSTPMANRLSLWSRIPANSSIWSSYPDPASGPSTPHFEVIVGALVRLSLSTLASC